MTTLTSHLPVFGRRDIQNANECRDLTVRQIVVRAHSMNVEERSIEAVIATEAPVRVFDMRTFEIIDEVLVIDGAVLREQIVLLDSHMRHGTENIRGSIRDLRKVADEVIGRLFLAGDERSLQDWNLIRDGHLTDVSVGYEVVESVDLAPGTKMKVSGRDYQAGERTLRVATK